MTVEALEYACARMLGRAEASNVEVHRANRAGHFALSMLHGRAARRRLAAAGRLADAADRARRAERAA